MEKFSLFNLDSIGFDTVFGNSEDLVCVLDLEHNIVRSNKTMSDILGIDDKVIAGKKCYSCVHKSDKPPTYCPFLQLLEDENPHTADAFVEHLNKWLSISVTPLKDKSGKLRGALHIARDISESVNTNIELIDIEKKFNLITRNTTDIITIYGKDYKPVYFSPSSEYITEYSINDFINGNSIFDIVIEEDKTRLIEDLNNSTKNQQKEWKGEYRIKTKSGKIKWIETKSNRTYDENGNPENIIAISRDITERKELERKINSVELRNKKLIKHLNDIIVILDDKGVITYISESVEQILGYKSDELTGKQGFDYLYPDDAGRLSVIFENILENPDKIYRDTYRHRHRDGHWVFLEAIGQNLLEDEDIRGILINVRDITDNKKAETEIIESELKFRSYIENAPDGVFLCTPAGFYVDVNNAACEMLGYSREELLKMHSSEIHIPGELDKAKKSFGIINETGKYKDEFEFVRKDGTTFYGLLSAVKISDTKFIGFVKNIDDIKKYQKELIEAKIKAEQSDEIKTAFMNNISHEIRTPLNGILGFAEILNDPEISEKERNSYLEMMNSSSTRLINTISAYLDTALLTSNNIEVNLKYYPLHSLFMSVFDNYSISARLKNLEYNTDIPEIDDSIQIYTDKNLFNKSIGHIIENAIKFTYKGIVKAGYIVRNNEVLFYIKDTGKGIKEDMNEKIFDFFIQEDISVSREFEGSGLGLSIAKGFSELLGGKIWFESLCNNGTTFYFSHPLNKTNIIELEKPAAVSVKEKPLILVVDDDETSYLYIQSILKNKNVTLIYALNGEEAIYLFEKHPEISIVLIDLRMPDISGYEVTDKIKSIRKNVPVIAVTAYALSGDEEKAIKAGCDDYISKPFRKNTLLDILNKYVSI